MDLINCLVSDTWIRMCGCESADHSVKQIMDKRIDAGIYSNLFLWFSVFIVIFQRVLIGCDKEKYVRTQFASVASLTGVIPRNLLNPYGPSSFIVRMQGI